MESFLRVQQILWMAMLGSLFFLGVVAFVVMPSGGQPAPHFLLAVFVGLAVADLVAVQFLRAKLLPAEPPPASLHEALPDADSPEGRRALQKLAQANLISWALCESVAMFGLMATEMLQQRVYYIGFAAVALIFLVLYRPDADDVSAALRGVKTP
jgi:hypothetical protein